jgi:hypothetical protein
VEVLPQRAYVHALAFLQHSARTVGQQPSGFPLLKECSVEERPTVILDLLGAPLFFDFPLISGGVPVGSVRTAADTSLGHPFVSIQTGLIRDFMDAREEAAALAAQELPEFELQTAEPVCFNYPRIGLLLTLRHPQTGDLARRIFDPEFPKRELLLIPEAGAGQQEGENVYSVLDTLPESGSEGPSVLFERADRLLEGLVRYGARGGRHRICSLERTDRSILKGLVDRALDNQPEGMGAPSEKVLTVPHLRQQESDYCVLACIEMLLRFHNVATPGNQEAIRAVLVQDPPLYAPLGVLPQNQVAAFKRCFSENAFVVTMDESPLWAEARDLINASLPFKSGIIGHARVGIGYHQAPITDMQTGDMLEIRRSLWINDPNSAQIRLELFEVETANPSDPASHRIRRAIPIKTNYVTVTPRVI